MELQKNNTSPENGMDHTAGVLEAGGKLRAGCAVYAAAYLSGDIFEYR